MTDEEIEDLNTFKHELVNQIRWWKWKAETLEKENEQLKFENAALRERLSHSLELPCMAKLEIVDDNDKHIKYIYFIFYKENGKFSSIKYLNKGAAESELAKLKGEKK